MDKPVIEINASDDRASEKFTNRWWTQKPEEIYKHVFGTVRTLETKQSYRTQENVKNARLYSDLEILGTYSGLYSPSSTTSTLTNRLSLNVVKSCIDTVTSKIAKSKPRPMFLTSGGDWSLRTKAQNLTKFIDGQFDAMNHYETKQDTFRDKCVFGTGATKFYIDGLRKKVCSERVVIEELLVDDAEGIYGTPPNLYQRRLVNKDVLMEIFPKYKGLIQGASADLNDNLNVSPGTQDLVKVIEAWHLPSGPDAGDGKHVICINNCTLMTETWEFDWFPFSFERWNKSLVGFFGIGIARELTGLQVEINKILRSIQQSMHLFAVPRVYIENSSQVNLAAINNDLGAIVKYTGTAPNFYTPQAMAPDVYQHLWNIYNKAFEISGISQLSASSRKPEGLNSGRALREFSDIESDRFQIVGQRREMSFLQDAKICIELMKKLSKQVGAGNLKVQIADQGSMKVIKWSDVHMDEEKYIMRAFPASILPTQPAARMQTIVEYAQAGFFEKETAMDLMDFPDIEAATNLQISPRRVVLKILDEMVETGKYQPPEPFMYLPQTKSLAQYYYLAAKNSGVPEKELELIRRFITQVISLEQQAMPAPMPMPGAPPPVDPMAEAALPASPEQAPTNPLLNPGA